jgi:prepilin-type N-terminal cleavage/methylation domain-containing protein
MICFNLRGKNMHNIINTMFTFFFLSSDKSASAHNDIEKLSPKAAKKVAKSKMGQMGGFSLLELIIVMSIMLILIGLTAVAFAGAMKTRERESSRTDALTAAQAAINVMSREIANSGFGLTGNGIVLADSDSQKLHIRANTNNSNLTTTDADEDITYYYDPTSQSVLRYDANATPSTAAVINQVSTVSFQYFDYSDSNSTPVVGLTPTANTGRVRITLIVYLANVNGQPTNQTITFTSDVTLRNSTYMLNQY